ncbi:dynein light chain roadblock-type 1 [Drosophila obscura]|uniref:dynein light chain roadblock-type 1 n=1 Tax=Drosophila obscura TaxID=7282 RepID=UPI000BA108BA|nr:dynein light chain roadblock-type 1 [Drosophila obscura]
MLLNTPERPPRSQRYVEEAFDQISTRKNIRDIVILNDLGHPVKSTMGHDDSVQFAGLFQAIRCRLERGMKQIDPTDELLMLRVRTRTNEVLLTPDSKITLIVVQNAQDHFQN